MERILIKIGLPLILLYGLVGCDVQALSEQYGTVIAPPAKTIAAQGGQIAQTQAARLLQTAQIKVATESANLKETAKVDAATLAASVIDTAQARLVTKSAGNVTAAPTQFTVAKETAQAEVMTNVLKAAPVIQTGVAAHFPQALTQVAGLAQTAQVEINLVTPQASGQPENQNPSAMPEEPGPTPTFEPIQSTPLPPVVSNNFTTTMIVYLVQDGDTLSSISAQFGIPLESIIFLNQSRLPWLTETQAITPGLTLVLSILPDAKSGPVAQNPQPSWSTTSDCDVTKVDWLTSPIECQPATIDVVSKVTMTIGCLTFQNPFGNTLTHTVYQGWMLTGADGVVSYGWFADLDRAAAIVGPAIVTQSSVYKKCQTPGN